MANFFDVIKYEGPAEVFVWKHECEDFNTNTQLIVHESQEAIFFKNGQALDSFLAGRYTLETQNIPILRRIIALPSGGVTPFHCEVYFVNKAVSMGMLWGTDSPIPMQDPQFGVFVNVVANGEFALTVKDSRKLLIKLVGTVPVFSRDEINRYFTGIMTSYVKGCIADIMTTNNISVRDVSARLVPISREIQKQLVPVFDEFGLALSHFSVGTIKVPASDPGLKEIGEAITRVTIARIDANAQADAERIMSGAEIDVMRMKGSAEADVMRMKGTAEADVRRINGITKQEELAYEVASTVAGNEGMAGTGAGIGMGVGMGMGAGLPLGTFAGSVVAGAMKPVFGAQLQPQQPAAPSAMPGGGMPLSPVSKPMQASMSCASCGKMNPPGSKFCNECGKKLSSSPVCPACGANLNPGSKFCNECGERIV